MGVLSMHVHMHAQYPHVPLRSMTHRKCQPHFSCVRKVFQTVSRTFFADGCRQSRPLMSSSKLKMVVCAVVLMRLPTTRSKPTTSEPLSKYPVRLSLIRPRFSCPTCCRSVELPARLPSSMSRTSSLSPLLARALTSLSRPDLSTVSLTELPATWTRCTSACGAHASDPSSRSSTSSSSDVPEALEDTCANSPLLPLTTLLNGLSSSRTTRPAPRICVPMRPFHLPVFMLLS
mmetsp:Transcript_80988/g.249911  ORF Transcript_80988/g.249911 Transcript_80988/m.249911 type:complete len:232 (-) Transcript_80988:549-1244(-)